MPSRSDREHVTAADARRAHQGTFASQHVVVVDLERVAVAEAIQQVGGVVGL
jgi:hypothetical protein